MAAPQIAGALFANGYREIRQYDFEVQIFQLELEHPGRLNLRAFFRRERFLSRKLIRALQRRQRRESPDAFEVGMRGGRTIGRGVPSCLRLGLRRQVR